MTISQSPDNYPPPSTIIPFLADAHLHGLKRNGIQTGMSGGDDENCNHNIRANGL